MSPGFNLDDYVDVAERIRLFYERFPDGRICTVQVTYADWGQPGILAVAHAYRSEADRRPAVGTAFEPVPGRTPYTKDSETMNAETAAWGRAIVACGIGAKKIASKEEVQARQGSEQGPEPTGAGAQNAPAPAEDPTAAARLGTNDLSTPEASTAQVARLRSKIGELRKLAPDDEYVRWWDGFSIGDDGKKLATAVLQKKLLPSRASAGIDKVQARIAELALGEPVEPELPAEPFPEPDPEKVAAFNEVVS